MLVVAGAADHGFTTAAAGAAATRLLLLLFPATGAGTGGGAGAPAGATGAGVARGVGVPGAAADGVVEVVPGVDATTGLFGAARVERGSLETTGLVRAGRSGAARAAGAGVGVGSAKTGSPPLCSSVGLRWTDLPDVGAVRDFASRFRFEPSDVFGALLENSVATGAAASIDGAFRGSATIALLIKMPASARPRDQAPAMTVRMRPLAKSVRGPTFASWCECTIWWGRGEAAPRRPCCCSSVVRLRSTGARSMMSRDGNESEPGLSRT